MLTEDSTQPAPPLPVAAFKAHLHLGTGHTEADLQDDLLAGFLRAASAAIEGRIGKVLLERAFILELPRWSDPAAQPLPLAPVTAITSLSLQQAGGSLIPVAPQGWRLERDLQRPCLRGAQGMLPAIPPGGQAILHLRAGLAPDWAGLPADLAQAVLMLAAHFYDYRHDTTLGSGCMPFGVTSLIARHRALRLSFGPVPHGAA
jgi:uncharacterized phiE125 gp8 family phage protein